MLIYHLALAPDWDDAVAAGEYRVSTVGQTIDEVGFIHASREDQLEATAARFYADLGVPLVLLVLDRAPGSTQSALAASLGIKRANFVAMMDELEHRGLAERTVSPSDKRSHAIFLTEKGRKTLERARALAQRHENRQIAKLGEGGVETLLGLLGQLSAK